MHNILQYSPGQVATITKEVVTNGLLTDGYSAPVIARVVFPNGTLASGFPATMSKISTGIYQYKFTLPTGITAVGSYIAVINYVDANNNSFNEVVELNVNVAFSNFSVTPG